MFFFPHNVEKRSSDGEKEREKEKEQKLNPPLFYVDND